MKKKTLGTTLAVLGTIICMGSAVGAYEYNATTNAGNGFGFGGVEYTLQTGGMGYRLGSPVQFNGDASAEDATPVKPAKGETVKRQIRIPMSGYYGDNLVSQDFIMGNISVSMWVDAALEGKVKTAVWVNGYGKSVNEMYKAADYNKLVGLKGDEVIGLSAAKTAGNVDVTVTAVANSSASMSVSTNQYLNIYLEYNFTTISESNILAMAESTVHIDVTWAAPSAETLASMPIVVGDKTQWKSDEYYMMVENLNAADKHEYMFKGIGTGWNLLKVKDGENSWHGCGNNNEENVTVADKNKNCDVYFNADTGTVTIDQSKY